MLGHTIKKQPNTTSRSGIADLMFKFDRSEIEALLLTGEEVEVTVSGEIEDTIYFVATNVIRVINPTMVRPNGGENVPAQFPYDIVWENPADWHVDHADLYYTLDGGETWEEIATGVTGDRFTWTTPVAESEQALVRIMVFDSQGMLGFDTSDAVFTLTGGLSAVENVIPTVYGLAQNFPNPFNPQTEIRFDLPHPGKTHLVVYDIRGRKVVDLVNEDMGAGRHHVVWTGKDTAGRGVASGVYYYQLKSGDFVETRRMTLVK